MIMAVMVAIGPGRVNLRTGPSWVPHGRLSIGLYEHPWAFAAAFVVAGIAAMPCESA